MTDTTEPEWCNWDRILRSSVPERHKGCTSPVGAVQNYIVELEQALERIRDYEDFIGGFPPDDVMRGIAEGALKP